MSRADAPGRVNLIGEHTDHNDGFVLPTPIPQRTVVECDVRPGDRVTARSDGFPGVAYRLGDERREGDWADHVRGVTWVLRADGHRIGGFDARARSTVPAGAGLGSSAALLVALLRALRAAFALDLDDLPLALAAHRAERDLVGAHVGTMDHLVASLGREGEALLIDTRDLAVDRVPLPPGAALVVIDSGIAHHHASGGYNRRRDECAEAARRIGVRALRDAVDADVDRLAAEDAVLARRARHVVREDARVLAFVAALRASDLAACGRILDASHASLRDDFAVSLPELDVLAEALRSAPGVFGARLVGGGFGGSILALATPAAAPSAVRAAVDAYRARTGRIARVLLAGS